MNSWDWPIIGIGICITDLEEDLDKERVALLLQEQLPEDENVRRIVQTGDYDKLNLDKYLHGRVFDNLADLFTYCDDTDTLTYADNNGGYCFLYYPPSMPWERGESDPDSREEVHRRIIRAVKKLTTMPESKIAEMIDDALFA